MPPMPEHAHTKREPLLAPLLGVDENLATDSEPRGDLRRRDDDDAPPSFVGLRRPPTNRSERKGKTARHGLSGEGSPTRQPSFVLVVPSGTEAAAAKSATAVNINGCQDQFYRYKCPQLIATCHNSQASKMVKTQLVNIDDVARSLQRPQSWLPAYIGYSWSAKVSFVPGAHWSVSGQYSSSALSEVVTQFVRDWILCPGCSNPELNIQVKKKKKGGSILLDCSACGYSGKQSQRIMNALPKMTAHVFNNPPDPATATQDIQKKQFDKLPGSLNATCNNLETAHVVCGHVEKERQQRIADFFAGSSDDESTDDDSSDDDSDDDASSADNDIEQEEQKQTSKDLPQVREPESESVLSKEKVQTQTREVFGQEMAVAELLQGLNTAVANSRSAAADYCPKKGLQALLPVTDLSQQAQHGCLQLVQFMHDADVTPTELQQIAQRFDEDNDGRGADFGVFLARELQDGPGISTMRAHSVQKNAKRSREKRLKQRKQEERLRAKAAAAAAKAQELLELESVTTQQGLQQLQQDRTATAGLPVAVQDRACGATTGGTVVHIRIQKRNGRKSVTTVTNLAQHVAAVGGGGGGSVSLKEVSSNLCKRCRCSVSVKNDRKFGQVLQLQGDHRETVKEFLIQENLVADAEYIMLHGF